MSEATKWVRRTGGGDSDRQIAMRAGIPAGTLGRQMANGLLTPENAVAIARAYKVSPLDGLVAVGLIRADDIERASAREALSGLADEDLVAEVLRRIQEGGESATVLNLPAPPVSPSAATLRAAHDDDSLVDEIESQIDEP